MGRIGIVLLFLVTVSCSKPEEVLDPKQYIVVFKKIKIEQSIKELREPEPVRDTVRKFGSSLSQKYSLKPAKHVFSAALQGGVYHLEDDQLAAMKADPDIAYIEQDREVHLDAVQADPTWGLDRIDQQNLPLDKKYEYDDSDVEVNAYVVDTGVMASHVQFGGRAQSGTDIVDKDADSTDCHGHGTHVAGTIGSALYGVAKNVKIFGVRVLSCSGGGSNAGVIAGVEWVAANHKKPAVANMSLGGASSQALDDAIAAATAAGVTFVVAAGNSNADACGNSPARAPSAITVGASDNKDARSSFSNYGTCVDVFAPGSDILSLGITNNSATDEMSGTSMASPHVAGVAALYLSKHPNALPAEVSAAIVGGAITGKITNAGSGSPNKLASARFLGGGGNEGGGEQPADPNELKNNAPVNALKGAKGEDKYFTLKVPAGAKSVTFTLSGGSGDADLYVRSLTKPTPTSYSCRPFKSGNSETCSFKTPVAGTWHVLLRGYSSYSGAKLAAGFLL